MKPETLQKVEDVKRSREEARESLARGQRMLRLAEAGLHKYPEEQAFLEERREKLKQKQETFEQMSQLTDTILHILEQRQ